MSTRTTAPSPRRPTTGAISPTRWLLRRPHLRMPVRRLGAIGTAVLVAAIWPAGVAHAGTTYYVSTTGSDSGAGTITSPWRTLARSMTRLSPGDTLFVRGGTYAERIQSPKLKAGTSGLRIKVAAYPG